MDEELKNEFSEFAFALGKTAGFASRALGSEEILMEFASRGISRDELQSLLEACKKVEDVFYNQAQPI